MTQPDLFNAPPSLQPNPTLPSPADPARPNPWTCLNGKPIPAWAIAELKAATVHDKKLCLANPKLEPEKYALIKKILANIGGKWVGGKEKAHLFPYDPTEILAAIIKSGRAPAKNPLDYFPTPADMLNATFQNWTYVIDGIHDAIGTGHRFLEPSAGTGNIIEKLLEFFPDLQGKIDAIELDPIRAAVLKNKAIANVHIGTFEEWQPTKKYAGVILNPPFNIPGDPTAYITHIDKARDLVENGILLAIAPTNFIHGKTKVKKEFYNWVADHCEFDYNETEAFQNSGTQTQTCMIAFRPRHQHNRQLPVDGYTSHHSWQVCMTLQHNHQFANDITELRKNCQTEKIGNAQTFWQQPRLVTKLENLIQEGINHLIKSSYLPNTSEKLVKGYHHDMLKEILAHPTSP